MFDLGWRKHGDPWGIPPAESPTPDVLRLLAGATRERWRTHGLNPAVAAVARTAMRA